MDVSSECTIGRRTLRRCSAEGIGAKIEVKPKTSHNV